MLSISVFFFFFKQKTAYEMRISDWSSDVCSSDLREVPDPAGAGKREIAAPETCEMQRRLGVEQSRPDRKFPPVVEQRQRDAPMIDITVEADFKAQRLVSVVAGRMQQPSRLGQSPGAGPVRPRSEEHTSELQSLMRISYAVFFLKKKKVTIQT